jgi:hypothetical protein
MAKSARGVFGEIGGMARGVGASYTAKSTKRGVRITGSVTKKTKPKAESFSYSEKDLTKKERKQIRNQNKVAESMKSKSLEKVESGKKAAKTRKIRQEEREDYAYSVGKKTGKKTGRIEGTAGTAVVGAAGISLYNKKKKSDKKKK